MRILHRYVFREVAAASLVGTILFTLVLFLQRVEPVMELLVGRGAPAAEMLRLLALTIPQAFPFTVPQVSRHALAARPAAAREVHPRHHHVRAGHHLAGSQVKWLRNGGQLRLRQMRQRSNCVRWCRIHHRQGGQ